MKTISAVLIIASTALAGCSPKDAPHEPVGNNATSNRLAAAPVSNMTGSPKPAKTSLPEPRAAIDPKSVEAAGQVGQLYGAYLESGERSKAAALWSDPKAANAFAQQLKNLTHLEIGDLTPAEGAAGSIYTTMSAAFYGKTARRRAEIILRRVNEVPGSTDVQRRWHIERIDWKGPPTAR